MITQLTKLKRSTASKYTYLGKEIFIWLDRQDGTVMVSNSTDFEDIFPVEKKHIEPINKGRSQIEVKPKVLTKKEKTETQRLNDFFIQISLTMPYNCMECSKPLYANNKFAKRCCSCHILPKSQFPSIATNKDNILFMGAGLIGICQCHDTWDSNSEARSKMKIYPLAIERFELLKPFLTDKEIIKAYTYFNLEWK